MKKKYVSPVMVGEMFTPDEYCSTCGVSGKTYYFKCDAGRYGTLLGYRVYDNGPDGKAGTRDDIYINNYTPCDKTHVAESTDEFINGYMCKDWGFIQGEAIPVIIWRGEDGHNVHCTTNLDIESWETAKS